MSITCKDCTERVVEPNCHITCEKYKKFVEERKRINSSKMTDFDQYVYERQAELKARKNKRLLDEAARGRKR